MLTDRLLSNWIRCKRKAWLDVYQSKDKRIWSPHRSLFLDHQQRSLHELISEQPGKGLSACSEGNSFVLGVRLKGLDHKGNLIEAHPPLLRRIKGNSKWGNFSYIPVITRQGKRITREHQLSTTIAGLLLEATQKSPVSKGLLVSKTTKDLEIENIFISKSLKNQLDLSLVKLKETLSQTNLPPLVSDKKKCSICSWKKFCSKDSIEEGHLREISGIGAKRREVLQSHGINNIRELAETNPDLISKSLGGGTEQTKVATDLVLQAKVQLGNYEECINKSPALVELQNCKGVLLYDIESDPDVPEDYLHGFISLPNKPLHGWDLINAKYHPLLTLKEHGQNLIWKRIYKKLTLYSDWPILHYGETEALAVSKIASKQNLEHEHVKELKLRFIDIHSRVKQNWRLPLNSYGLKVVAGFTGFKWSQQGADGAKALLHWRLWKASQHRKKTGINHLKWIMKYNKDDCLATWSITKWLLEKDKSLS